jgi:hypothetical protein
MAILFHGRSGFTILKTMRQQFAALDVMMKDARFQTMMTEAVEAARARGAELGAA